VLMDIQMPELDGLEATARIRDREKTTGRHVPIIALTAHATQGDRTLCLESGMDSYVSKPIRREELMKALNDLTATAGSDPAVAPLADAPVVSGGVDAEAPFNEAELLRRLGGDEDLLTEIAAMFLESGPTAMAAIEGSLAKGDLNNVTHAAHSLKGSVGNFAAKRAVEAALRMEMAARQGDDRAANEALKALQTAIASLIATLKVVAARRVPCES
jgi:two-component system, sensor histidine kinase and response regulator